MKWLLTLPPQCIFRVASVAAAAFTYVLTMPPHSLYCAHPKDLQPPGAAAVVGKRHVAVSDEQVIEGPVTWLSWLSI